jgi:hypothetical protein
MPFFISNPVRIEAMQIPPKWDGETVPYGLSEISVWLMHHNADWQYHEDGGINIRTLEGVMKGDVGDWIIRGTRGEFYPCKPDVFAVKYRAELG